MFVQKSNFLLVGCAVAIQSSCAIFLYIVWAVFFMDLWILWRK